MTYNIRQRLVCTIYDRTFIERDEIHLHPRTYEYIGWYLKLTSFNRNRNYGVSYNSALYSQFSSNEGYNRHYQ